MKRRDGPSGMMLSTNNLPFKLLLSLTCISILLQNTLADNLATTSPSPSSPTPTVGPFRRSYVFMTATNKRTGKVAKTCVNYQQFQSNIASKSVIPERVEDAKPFIFKYWRGEHLNTKVCPLPTGDDPRKDYFGSIVPLEYRNPNDGSDCALEIRKDQGWKSVNVLKENNASAALLIVDRGHISPYGWKDYLFNDFFDPAINDTTSIPTFFVYRKDLDDNILSIATQDAIVDEEFEIRFHRPSIGLFDNSMIFIWMISMICVTGGGLWAFYQARDRVYYVKYGHPWWRQLNRHVEEERQQKTILPRGLEKLNPETTTSDDSLPNLDHLTIAILVEEHFDPEGAAADAEKISVPKKKKTKKKKNESGKLYLYLAEIAERNPHATGIFFLIFAMISVLMLAFYFRSYLVFLFNVLLVFTGTSSMYSCIRAFLSNFPFSEHGWYRTKMEWVPVLFGSQKYSYADALFALLSFTFCATWFFVRSDVYGFVLLDIINIAVSLNVLSLVRMPSMKVITIILVAMYFYDAFMVFGTPYLTENGCSIMVQVATGIDDCTEHVPEEGEIAAHPTAAVDAMALPEKFPMMILVPQMDPMNECMDMEVELFYPISILGLGDIVLPGYLISHCFTMSGFTNKGRLLYGFVALSGYALGLVATFTALMMYQVAQPALIYLVPCTLLPVLAVAAIRQEFGCAWEGCDGCMTILYNHRIPGCSSSNESESKKEKEVGDVVFENAEESASTETAICGESTSVNDLVIL